MPVTTLSSRFNDALMFAADIHRDQRRKGTDIPYISHVLAVASIVLEAGGDEDEAIAALLHDAVEDAPRELDPNAGPFVRKWIGMKFGACVQAIVDACTDADTRDSSGKKINWTVRKTAYIEGIAHKSAAGCLVSAADKVHNARAILQDFRAESNQVWDRFNKEAGGREPIVGYYRGLADAFSARSL
jgi:(p)ppGpp synthase/HD superfamily hydrolase